MSGRKALRGRAAALARLLPSGPSQAARAPFVLLVVVLLAGGLITLLVLNSSLNEGSFQVDRLKKQTTDLTDEQQELQRDVDAYAAPDALARRAAELGMVPGGSPAFLGPDGKVRGVPSAAPEGSALRLPPPTPTEAPAPTPSPAPTSTASTPPPSSSPSPSPAGATAGDGVTPGADVTPGGPVASSPSTGPTPATSAVPTPSAPDERPSSPTSSR